jgi:hypothetical protein
MKYIIILFLLLSSCIPLPAQNTVSLTFADNDLAIGGRYDRQINRMGIYGGIGYGCYRSKFCGITEHYKALAGVERFVTNYASKEWITYFSVGVNAHHYNEIEPPFVEMSPIATSAVSFEFGVGFIIRRKAVFGWTYDPLKKDVTLNVGIRFGH